MSRLALLDSELVRWLQPVGCYQLLYAQVEAGHREVSALAMVLFNIFINDMVGIECTFSKLEDVDLSGAVDMTEWVTSGETWTSLRRAHEYLIRFNKSKHNVLHRAIPNGSRLGEVMENSPVEKDLRIIVDEKLDVSQKYVLAAWKVKSILVCTKRWLGVQGRRLSPSARLL